MRIITKRLKVIQMTQEEIRKFHDLMAKAEQGHTSHYAEEQMNDGSFLGVQIVPAETQFAGKHVKNAYPQTAS